MKRNSAANDGEGATSDSPTADVPAPVRKSRWRIARENIEAVLVAVILALIIRHFSLEAFQIPTGSMAPGLNGFHVTTTCPNCGTESDVGIAEENAQRQWQRGPFYESECTGCGAHVQDAQRIGQAAHCSVCGNSEPSNADGFHKDATFLPFTAWCPECGLEYTEIVEPKDVRAGHRILVNKFTYFLRDPHRWEVIVFKFNHQRNYIKRLIGLPGERVQVRRGDVWINGEIVRKPIAVQDNMWFQVHDTDIVERGLKQKPWSPSGKDVWAGREDGGFSFNALDADGGLSYARPILNRYSYNALQQRNYQPAPQDRWARDLRLRAAIRV